MIRSEAVRLTMAAVLATVATATAPTSAAAQGSAEAGKARVVRAIDAAQGQWTDVAHRIWGFAELGFQEKKSTALLQDQLREAGFTVNEGVAGMPTAFVASWGSGKPVIGILAEFDALPGLSQAAEPVRDPVVEHGAGHGCGHNLFGTASTAAAVAVKQWLQESGRSGTVRVYGTPAEEGGSGKVFMVRKGLFDDVDVVLGWHPGDQNDAGPSSNLAVISANFSFHGVSAHAAAAPDHGRSALDGVEAMDAMVNLMREHVPQTTRIHYIISHGGLAPNVVPDFAEVEYYVRHPSADTVKDLFERVVAAAKGAAMGTGTTVDYEITSGSYARLDNETLARLADANLRAVGGVSYSEDETRFARKLQESFGPNPPALASADRVQPFEHHMTYASSDAGDVSWVVPTVTFTTATWVPGTSAHSWQAVAADGMSIGAKGMIVAAKTLAMTAVDLYTDPATVKEARAEFDKARGADFHYVALLGDRGPPLDYRAGR